MRPLTPRVRRWSTPLAVVLLLASTVVGVPGARAELDVIVITDFPSVHTVGEGSSDFTITVTNNSNDSGGLEPLDPTIPVNLESVGFIPSCGTFVGSTCTVPEPPPAVFRIANGVGAALGVTGTCVGTLFDVTPDTPAAGRYHITPQASVVLGPSNGAVVAAKSCGVRLTLQGVDRIPSFDSSAAAGIQTSRRIDAFISDATGRMGDGGQTSPVTVNRATPGFSTSVPQQQRTVTVGDSISDTATVVAAGAPPVAQPTASVSFSLFRLEDDPTPCAGPAVFTSGPHALPASPGPYTVTSGSFATALVGTYRWTAAYTGDTNYDGAVSGCLADPTNETSVVEQALPEITTLANPTTGPIGGAFGDTATITGLFDGTGDEGSITFVAYPNSTCTLPAAFTSSAVTVNGNGAYDSTPAFNPTAAGTYFWVATYSGDENNAGPISTACDDQAEMFEVERAEPDLTTVASDTVEVGNDISDTATLSNATSDAGGTITFRLYGPDDDTCANPPVFVSTPPVDVTGNGIYVSGPFEATAVGTYRWTAEYSGDDNNVGLTTSCNDPLEDVEVTPATPSIFTEVSNDTVSVGVGFTDTATVTGGFNPTGEVTFLLYGPDDDTCAGPPIFESVILLAAGSATSGAFVPTQPGVYRWIASYEGDDNNLAIAGSCGDPNETVTVRPEPTIDVQKDVVGPDNLPEPGGTFTFQVTITNTSAIPLTITSVRDDIYNTPHIDDPARVGSTCDDLIGDVLAPSGQPNDTATCTFTGDFVSNANSTQVDTVTAVAVDDAQNEATDSDQATVRITDVLPVIDVQKVVVGPASLAEPGGTFTFSVTITNLSAESVQITSIRDDIYTTPPIDDAARVGSTCDELIGDTLAPSGEAGDSATCTFTGEFNGMGGASQTDTVTATAEDDDGNEASDFDDATVGILNLTPSIVVDKDASPPTRPEPGGTFTFTVTILNNSVERLTILSVRDDIYTNPHIDDPARSGSTCDLLIGTFIDPGLTASCTFTGDFTGNAGDSQTDTVRVDAEDDENTPVFDTDDATVTLTNVLPTVLVDKTGSPLSLPEPGGTFTYTVRVTNTSAESVTITTLTDSVYGNLATRGSCTSAIGTVLAPAASYTCAFSAPFTGNAGNTLTDVVTVVVTDDDDSTATDSDDATVRLTNVLPTIVVVKTANPLTRPEPGGSFTFTVTVTNTSAEAVTVTSLFDNVYGDLRGQGTCGVGAVLAPGGSYTCAFSAAFTGDAGDSQTDVVIVTVIDDDGTTATDSDDAIVRITNVLPTIEVTKTANPTSVIQPGGNVVFTVTVANTSAEVVRLLSLVDDVFGNLNGRGTCATGGFIAPGAAYTCSFTGLVNGVGGTTHVNEVTATAIDNDGSIVIDRDTADVRVDVPVVSVTTPPPTLVRTGSEPGGPVRLAAVLVFAGLLMLVVVRRSEVAPALSLSSASLNVAWGRGASGRGWRRGRRSRVHGDRPSTSGMGLADGAHRWDGGGPNLL